MISSDSGDRNERDGDGPSVEVKVVMLVVVALVVLLVDEIVVGVLGLEGVTRL